MGASGYCFLQITVLVSAGLAARAVCEWKPESGVAVLHLLHFKNL